VTSTPQRKWTILLDVFAWLTIIVTTMSVVQLYLELWDWFPSVSFGAALLSCASDGFRHLDDTTEKP
jgi:hypothetical protein